MVMRTKVEIDGVDVTAYVRKYQYERNIGIAIPVVKIEVIRKITDEVTLEINKQVKIWRGYTTPTDELIFKGYIINIEHSGGIINITCGDMLVQLRNKNVTYSYDKDIDPSAGKISEIFKDLVTTWGGLNADDTSVQDSGTAYTLKRFICKENDVFERCKKLAEILDWQFYYRADTDKVYFEPKGHVANSNPIRVGQEIVTVPKWVIDDSELYNYVRIEGAYIEGETTQYFSGDGSTKTFTLDYSPVSTKVYVNGVLKKAGQPGVSSDYDYTYDKDKKTITFNEAPPSGTDNIQVDYVYAIPIPVEDYDQASIDKYGERKKVIHERDAITRDDAETKLRKYLEVHSEPFYSTKLKVKSLHELGLEVGQKVYVQDTVNNISRWLVITRHIIRYPQDYDEIDVGDKVYRTAHWEENIEKRLKKMEEETQRNEELLLNIIHAGKNETLKRKQLTIQSRSIGSVFVLAGKNDGGINPNSQLSGDGVYGGKLAPTGDSGSWTDEYDITY